MRRDPRCERVPEAVQDKRTNSGQLQSMSVLFLQRGVLTLRNAIKPGRVGQVWKGLTRTKPALQFWTPRKERHMIPVVDAAALLSPTPDETPSPKKIGPMSYFNLICGVATLTSMAFGFYWYFQSRQERAPIYYVNPARTKIVDTTVPAPPQLQVLYKGKELNANVSAVTLYFWNDGKLPIKAEDVLDPLHIDLDPDCEILSARVLRVSRPVIRFAKGDVADSSKNSLPFSFGILEHGDGAVVQVIYAGKADSNIHVAGEVVGAGKSQSLVPPDYAIPPSPHRSLAPIVFELLFAGFCAWNGAQCLRALIKQLKSKKSLREKIMPTIVASILAGLFVGGALFLLHLAFVATSSPTIPLSIWSPG